MEAPMMLDSQNPAALVAVAKAAHTSGDRELERAAKALLREEHGIEIAFRRRRPPSKPEGPSRCLLYTVKQVAELLGIRQHGVLTLIRSGELLAIDVSLHPGGRPRWRISSDNLEAFLAKRTRRPEPPRRRRRRSNAAVTKYF